MSKETWKEFASEALLSYEYGVVSLGFDEFGKVEYFT